MASQTKDYIDCIELIQRTGVSPSKGYAIIRQLNAKIRAQNPDALIIPGKVSRAYYEQNAMTMHPIKY